ncbi:LOW QUALITY PROTEIN: uncharacterized protein LOC128260802 [Drosophila gunungcola]|uniref:LOW QUALITY PROTEIN: uncharacterized protein LOC128260802 n=1 Tax=Drosophila gunungcola TaxID=103775 RepID=UPI0022E71A39|nr:LOW QUALITY PROTEIN: uncharacterized protein LOC128260802 [Drosophila gunungcola]
MDGDQIHKTSSDQELEYSRCPRSCVHYATIAEFLTSLNSNDTNLGSVQSIRSLSLEDYLNTVRCAKNQHGDNDITLGTRNVKKPMQDISRLKQKNSNCPNKRKLKSLFRKNVQLK